MRLEKAIPPEDTLELRKAILDACLFLKKMDYFVGTWGNLSVRVKHGFLITPSRVEYEKMVTDDLVVMSIQGKKIAGKRLPSSEMELHRMILMKRPDIGSLVHIHSPYASSLACAGLSLPVCLEEIAQIIGGEVKCTCYVRGGLHKELAQMACETIGNESVAVLLANHGSVVGGRDLPEAITAAQVLEKAAMVFINASAIQKCKIIPYEEIVKERLRYLYKYGKVDDFLNR